MSYFSDYNDPLLGKPLNQKQISKLLRMPFNRGPRPRFYEDGQHVYVSRPWLHSLPMHQEKMVWKILEKGNNE